MSIAFLTLPILCLDDEEGGGRIEKGLASFTRKNPSFLKSWDFLNCLRDDKEVLLFASFASVFVKGTSEGSHE